MNPHAPAVFQFFKSRYPTTWPSRYRQRAQWVPFVGPRGGKLWRNTTSGTVVYGEQPPTAATAAEAIDMSEGDVASEQIAETAKDFGIDLGRAGDHKHAARFVVRLALQMGHTPDGNTTEEKARSSASFLNEHREMLDDAIDAARAFGYRGNAKEATQRAKQASDFIIRRAMQAGFEPQAYDPSKPFVSLRGEMQDALQYLHKHGTSEGQDDAEQGESVDRGMLDNLIERMNSGGISWGHLAGALAGFWIASIMGQKFGAGSALFANQVRRQLLQPQRPTPKAPPKAKTATHPVRIPRSQHATTEPQRKPPSPQSIQSLHERAGKQLAAFAQDVLASQGYDVDPSDNPQIGLMRHLHPHAADDGSTMAEVTTDRNSAIPYRDVQSAHEYLQSLLQSEPDGYGQSHDLSAVFGPGAVGYTSPAGSLAIIPPERTGGSYDVRYSVLSDTNRADADDQQEAEQSESDHPEPATDSTQEPVDADTSFDFGHDHVEPEDADGEEEPPELVVSPETKFGKVVAEHVGTDDPWLFNEFAQRADELYQQRQREAHDHNAMYDEILENFAPDDPTRKKNPRRVFLSQLRNASDPSTIRGFDEIVEFAQREYPHMFSGYASGEYAADSPEQAVYERLLEGKRQMPTRTDPAILQQTMDEINHAYDFDRESYADENVDWDAVDFARRGWKIRYQRWAKSRLSRWRTADAYARRPIKPMPGQLSLFGEDGPKEGQTRKNRAGNEEVLRGGRWHLANPEQGDAENTAPTEPDQKEPQPDAEEVVDPDNAEYFRGDRAERTGKSDQMPPSPSDKPVSKDSPKETVLSLLIETTLTPAGLSQLVDAPTASLGHATEMLRPHFKTSTRSDIRDAIEAIRAKHAVTETPRDSSRIQVALNSPTPTLDELQHALDRIEDRGNGTYYVLTPDRDKYERGIAENRNQAVLYAINTARMAMASDQGNPRDYRRVRGSYRSFLKSHGTTENKLMGIDPKQIKAAAQKRIDAADFSVDSYNQVISRLYDTDEPVSPDDLRDAHESIIKNADAIKAELNQQTKKTLAAWAGGFHRPGDPKSRLVDAAYHRMKSRLNLSPEGESWTHGQDPDDARRDKLSRLTQEHIDERRQQVKQARVERQQRSEQALEAAKAQQEAEHKATENPKTLDDFRTLAAMKSREGVENPYWDLTPEQRRSWDQQEVSERRAEREAKQAELNTVEGASSEAATNNNWTIVPGYHTKFEHDMWSVTPATFIDADWKDLRRELTPKAEALGGWYGRRWGKTPSGWHFKTSEAAQKFVNVVSGKASDSSTESQQQFEAKAVRTADRLRRLADGIEAKGQESLAADRRTNTARQAAMAGAAEGKARQQIARAETMRNIAEAIDSGTADLLSGVSTGADIETLDNLLSRAKWDYSSKVARNPDGTTKRNYELPKHLQHPAISENPTSIEMIDGVDYPYPGIHRDWLRDIQKAMKGKRGIRQQVDTLVAEANRASDKQYIRFTKPHQWEAFKSILLKLKKTSGSEYKRIYDELYAQSTPYRRLQKMGVDTPHELREALRQYHSIRSSKPRVDPVRQAERDLIGRKLPGFFPTPPSLVDRMLNAAGIRSGHSVLEPSAGKGDILDAIAEQHSDAQLNAIEYNRELKPVLDAKGHEVDYGDFLDHEGQYDRIVMNPPYENNQDIRHVQHAYEQLKPGGRLVAVISAGGGGQREKFDEWLERHGGYSEELTQGSFNTSEAFRKTGVNTRMVVVDKDA